jgi:hypothetical protein
MSHDANVIVEYITRQLSGYLLWPAIALVAAIADVKTNRINPTLLPVST